MEIFSQELIGALMIGVMLFAIFIGFPISFTLIFLGLVFGYWGFGQLVFYLMTLQFNMIMTESTLVAVPLFIFMGILMESAGLMERLFSAIQLMLSRTRGALFYAVMFVSTIFAAATGIVGASVTILGIMAGKTMIKSGYDTRLSAGLMERLFNSVQLMLSKTRGALFYAVMFVSTIFAAATGIVGASVTILGIMAGKTMIRSGYDTRLSAGLICAGGTLGILIPPSIMLVVMGPVPVSYTHLTLPTKRIV